MAESAVMFPRKGTDYVPLPSSNGKERVTVHAVQTIAAQPQHIFDLYTRTEVTPTWQEGVISVTPVGNGRYHWIVEEPSTGTQTEFDSEVVTAIPGVRHVSRVQDGPFAGSTDSLTFEEHPHGRGTIVTWVSEFVLPAASISSAIAGITSRGPQQAIIENLRRLKQLVESGQIPSVEGQPAGPRGLVGRWKQFLMGENLPVPPGTSDRARPRDLPHHAPVAQNPWLLAAVAVVAGASAWYGVRSIRSL